MRMSDATPEIATPRSMAMTAGAFLVAGGLPGSTLVFSSHGDLSGRGWFVAGLALPALLSGFIVLRWGHRLPRWAFHVMTGSATLVITAGVWASPWTDFALALTAMYAFISFDAFFFFSRRLAVLQVSMMLVAGTGALIARSDVSVASIIALPVVQITISWVVAQLVARASSASRDSLTGLINRRGFDEAFEAALEEAARTGDPVSVALVDVDHFKEVNDVRGHAAGDGLLQAIAHSCARVLPAGVLLARHGGDEFAILMPRTSHAHALVLVEAVRVACLPTGLSCGVAGLVPGQSGGDLMRRADAALYEAKAAGRGRCVLASADNDQLAADLAVAIAADDVRVYFQPIVSVADGTVVGVEALARWHHAERGFVPPSDFIPAAEAAGLIVDLGACMLAAACRDAQRLSAAWGTRLRLTVNVSGRELTEPGYAEAVVRILETTGWPASRLVLEVTESMLEASAAAALATLESLRQRGIAVAIDDFGTGYSAFSRLDTMPADYLKLDSSFISTTTTSDRRAAMLTALLGLSESLGLQVIAEGVETPEHDALLLSLRCPLAQGYLYSRPKPVEQLISEGQRVAVRQGSAV